MTKTTKQQPLLRHNEETTRLRTSQSNSRAGEIQHICCQSVRRGPADANVAAESRKRTKASPTKNLLHIKGRNLR